MGSRHGTYVNGTLIGKRGPHETPEEGQKRVYSAFPLGDGDKLQLAAWEGKYAIELTVERLAVLICYDCGEEIPEYSRIECVVAADRYRCLACQSNTVLNPPSVGLPEDPVRELIQDIRQSTDASGELGPLAEYNIQALLGQGGCGVVHRAVHTATGAVVALKVMRPDIAANKRARLAFDRERTNMLQLNHPNIVKIHSSGVVRGMYYFDMELCNAGTVASRMIELEDVLPVEEAVDLCCQMLVGLEYAHQAPIPNVLCGDGQWRAGRGLVHRDLKPGNLMLHQDGGALILKIGDIGLAKAFDLAGMSAMTMVGDLAGTPKYLCRQQVIDFRTALPEVDIWAAAACLYAMLTASPPKRFDTGKDPWVVAVDSAAVPIQDRRRERGLPALSNTLARAIDLALNDQDELLHKSAASFREDLERATSR